MKFTGIAGVVLLALFATLELHAVSEGQEPQEVVSERDKTQEMEQFIAELGSDDVSVRVNAARNLGYLEDARAVPALINAFDDTDADVRRFVTGALDRIGADAVLPLVSALKSDSWRTRYHAADTLGLLGDERAVDPLIATLSDPNERVRNRAMHSLGDLRDPRAVPALIEALDDRRNGGYPALPLGRIGDIRALDAMVAALGHQDSYVRYLAAEGLRELGDPKTIPHLLHALRDDHQPVRSVAMRALADFEDASFVDHLLPFLDHEDWRLRRDSARALGRLGKPRSVSALEPLLNDENEFVRSAAAEALERLGAQAAPATTAKTPLLPILLASVGFVGVGLVCWLLWRRRALANKES